MKIVPEVATLQERVAELEAEVEQLRGDNGWLRAKLKMVDVVRMRYGDVLSPEIQEDLAACTTPTPELLNAIPALWEALSMCSRASRLVGSLTAVVRD